MCKVCCTFPGVMSHTGHSSRSSNYVVTYIYSSSCRKIYGVVSLLLELGLPHNLAMHRGQPFDQQQGAGRRGGGEGSSEEKMVVRTLLIPRKPSFGQHATSLLCNQTNFLSCMPLLHACLEVTLTVGSGVELTLGRPGNEDIYDKRFCFIGYR